MANEIPGQIEHLVQEDRLTTPIWYEWFTYLRGVVRSLLVSQTNAEAAWTAFTPTATASGGGGPPTITSLSRYRQVGKTVNVIFDVTITGLGGGVGFLQLTLPVATSKIIVFTGRESAITGKMLAMSSLASNVVAYYDNTTTLAVNVRVIMHGTYEV